VELPAERVELRAAVEEGVSHLKNIIEEKAATLRLEVDPQLTVLGHHQTLVQVMTNLLSNAVKFVGEGIQPVVRVRTERRNAARLRLWVEDNGIGIDPAHQQRIFEVFHRLHGEESYPGTGIGLALVKKGIERMGGQVGVESEVGSGSRFWIEMKTAH
jgi:signal transduction histidine kinase